MDKQTYIQLDRIEAKTDTILNILGIRIDPQTGLPITQQKPRNQGATTNKQQTQNEQEPEEEEQEEQIRNREKTEYKQKQPEQRTVMRFKTEE